MKKPKYTKEQRSTFVKAFSAAKEYLWSGKGKRKDIQKTAICFALARACYSEKIKHDEFQKARRLIEYRLGGHATVTSFLRFGQCIDSVLLNDRNIQAYRHRWLKALIKEFSQ